MANTSTTAFVMRPIKVEAAQLLPKLVPPEWMLKAETDGLLTFDQDPYIFATLKTQSGDVRVDIGDWLVSWPGGLFRCGTDTFLKLFEAG